LFLPDALFHTGYISTYFVGLWLFKPGDPDCSLKVLQPILYLVLSNKRIICTVNLGFFPARIINEGIKHC